MTFNTARKYATQGAFKDDKYIRHQADIFAPKSPEKSEAFLQEEACNWTLRMDLKDAK